MLLCGKRFSLNKNAAQLRRSGAYSSLGKCALRNNQERQLIGRISELAMNEPGAMSEARPIFSTESSRYSIHNPSCERLATKAFYGQE